MSVNGQELGTHDGGYDGFSFDDSAWKEGPGGFTSDYEELPLTPAGRAALKPGRNIFAIHGHQTGGGHDLDVGISSLIEKPQPQPEPSEGTPQASSFRTSIVEL